MLKNIQQLIDQNRLDESLELIRTALDDESADQTEELLVIRGKVYWRMQRYSEAVSDFERAVAINPESEAGPALQLARDIFDFYNPDLLNP